MNFLHKIISLFILVVCISIYFLPDAWAVSGDQGVPPTTIPPDATASLAVAIVKVAGALALVVGLMILTMKIIRKLGMGRSDLTSGSLISILDTKMIAPKKYVAVLKIADELVAVGITDQQINLISHLENSSGELSSAATNDPPANNFSFPDILDRAAGSIKNLRSRHK